MDYQIFLIILEMSIGRTIVGMCLPYYLPDTNDTTVATVNSPINSVYRTCISFGAEIVSDVNTPVGNKNILSNVNIIAIGNMYNTLKLFPPLNSAKPPDKMEVPTINPMNNGFVNASLNISYNASPGCSASSTMFSANIFVPVRNPTTMSPAHIERKSEIVAPFFNFIVSPLTL